MAHNSEMDLLGIAQIFSNRTFNCVQKFIPLIWNTPRGMMWSLSTIKAELYSVTM